MIAWRVICRAGSSFAYEEKILDVALHSAGLDLRLADNVSLSRVRTRFEHCCPIDFQQLPKF